MLTATAGFMDSFEKWLRAARADDFAAAKGHAESLVRTGEMLALHPDFRRCFAQHFPALEPKHALMHLCQFLVCATEGRARVLQRWIEDNQPLDRLNEPDV